MPFPLGLARSRAGVITTLDLSGVADGTELNGLLGWTVYQNGGAGTGFFEVRGGEIRTVAAGTPVQAVWRPTGLLSPGGVMVAEQYASNWGSEAPGLVINAYNEAGPSHSASSQDQRCFLYNSYEFRSRSGAGDYGIGFTIATGATPGAPFTNGAWVEARVGVVQVPATSTCRTRLYMGGQVIGAEGSLTGTTGIHDGSDTCGGLISWSGGSGNSRWRNVYTTWDYRLWVLGLSGSQGFRLYNASGVLQKSSGVQVGNAASVDIMDLAWPFTGYIQVFDDAPTYSVLTTGGRWPSSGSNASIYGGDVIEEASAVTPLLQVNWDNEDSYPDEWATPLSKDVTPDLMRLSVDRAIANPEVTVDTLTFILRDESGNYVIGNPFGALYPNVRTGRKVRLLANTPDGTVALFFGYIREINPILPTEDSEWDVQVAEFRCESPARKLAGEAWELTAPQVGGAAVPDPGDPEQGVIGSIFKVVASVLPVATWDFDAIPDEIPDSVLEGITNWSQVIAQATLYLDAVWWIEPFYKTSPSEFNFRVRYQSRSALPGAAADHDWDQANGDMDGGFFPRFTDDTVLG